MERFSEERSILMDALGMRHRADVPDVTQNFASVGNEKS